MRGAARGSAAHEVRIIAGRWRRSRLPVADAPGLRPTPDRVRETLFNWLGPNLEGWRCLDAFAGTGALGLEAASRGAASVWLLEQNPLIVRRLHEVCTRLGAYPGVKLVQADAMQELPSLQAQGHRFDLVFLDPPYALEAARQVLAMALPLLEPGGWVYLESGQALEPEVLAAHYLTLFRQGRAGQVHYHLLQFSPPALACGEAEPLNRPETESAS